MIKRFWVLALCVSTSAYAAGHVQSAEPVRSEAAAEDRQDLEQAANGRVTFTLLADSPVLKKKGEVADMLQGGFIDDSKTDFKKPWCFIATDHDESVRKLFKGTQFTFKSTPDPGIYLAEASMSDPETHKVTKVVLNIDCVGKSAASDDKVSLADFRQIMGPDIVVSAQP